MLTEMQAHHAQLKEYLSKWCELQDNLIESSYAKQRKESLEKVQAAWHLLHDLQGSLEGNIAHDAMLGNAMVKLEEALGRDGRFPLGAELVQSVQWAPVPNTQEVPTGAPCKDVVFAERGDEAVIFAERDDEAVQRGAVFFAESGDGAASVQDTEVLSTQEVPTDAVTADTPKSKLRPALSTASSFGSSTVQKVMSEKLTKKQDTMEHGGKIEFGNVFEIITALVICLNAITMGISANHEIDHVNSPENQVLSNLEIAFVCFYTIEILVRVAVLGKEYFFGKGWEWNVFDVVLVLLAAYELGPGNVSFLRTARLLKMVKLIRIVRHFKTFKPLRLILSAILGSVGAVLWSSVLVFIVMYVCSICFVQASASLLERNNDMSPTMRAGIEDYWGSVLLAIHSLFLLSFGGASVLDFADSLREAGIIYYLVLMAYMLFFNVVVMNTVGSIFVDAVLQSSADDDDNRVQMELEKKDEYISVLQKFFNEVDDDGDGKITLGEFSARLMDPRLYAFAESLDMEVFDARQFFEIMSNHGSSPVDITTFVVGCIKLRGAAKSVDVHSVFQKVKQVNRNVEKLYSCLEGEHGPKSKSSVEANALSSVFQIVNNIQMNVERLCSGLEREQYAKSTYSVELKDMASL